MTNVKLKAVCVVAVVAVPSSLVVLSCDSPADPVIIKPEPVSGEVFIGAGDIARCDLDGDELTAQVIDSLLLVYPSATVFAAGDNAYENGTTQEYADCYDPTWGRFKDRTWAVLGNHEYQIDAGPAFDYFGARIGPRDLGYYSFDLGDWHIVMLNTNRGGVRTDAGSPQEQWVREDLATNSKSCVLAVMHHPRFHSCSDTEEDGGVCELTEEYLKPLWDALYEGGTDVIVTGHRHWYERFPPLNPEGVVDAVDGIREFIVGTGGAPVGSPAVVHPQSETQNPERATQGVIKMILDSASYSWQFIPARDKNFTDSGSDICR